MKFAPTRPLMTLATAAALSAATTVAPASAAVDVVELTAEDIAAGLALGEYTSTDLVGAFFDQINTYEPTYNAFISFNPDAMAEAAALDAEYASIGPRGPLHGVPVVVKDNIDMGGLVTTAGFEGFSSAAGGVDMIPGDDAAVVTRLRDAGAIILGKTNLPDFAFSGTRTYSTVAGTTLNAYNINKAPGGSSGGTATAVAASFAVLGLGTETGGSIENPSGAQGLVGVKPTFGLVPLEGVVPIDATYRDVVGPMAKTSYDAAIALDALAGPTDEDYNTYASVGKIPAGGYTSLFSDTALQGKRFGLVGTGWRDSFLPLDPTTDALYQQAIADLEAEGATVVADPFAGTDFKDVYENEDPGGVPGLIANGIEKYLDGLGDGAAFNSRAEWEAITGDTFPIGGDPVEPTATIEGDEYQAWRDKIRGIFTQVLEDNDLDGLFFPQAGGPIPDAIIGSNGPNNHPELPSNIINDLGVPVVTLPYTLYEEDGVPFTLAFIGDLWTEAELLSYAFDLELATMGRTAPTLIPEPAAGGLLAMALLAIACRRPRNQAV